MNRLLFSNEILYRKFVHPIHCLNAEIDGCGVFVDSLFLTVGHVGNQPFFVNHNGERINFSPEEAIFIQSEKRKQDTDYDIAVYPSKGVLSPIQFGDAPKLNTSLASYSYRHIGGEEECFKEIKSEGIVTEVVGNFFTCKMSKLLKGGSSGSPIFDRNCLIGLLVGCPNFEEDPKTILFISSVSILSRL